MSSTEYASLDPAFAKSQSTMWPAHQLFNTLVEIDDSLHIFLHWQKAGIFQQTEQFLFFICGMMFFFMMMQHFKMEREEN